MLTRMDALNYRSERSPIVYEQLDYCGADEIHEVGARVVERITGDASEGGFDELGNAEVGDCKVLYGTCMTGSSETQSEGM